MKFKPCMELGQAIANNVVTLGTGLDHCHIPGRGEDFGKVRSCYWACHLCYKLTRTKSSTTMCAKSVLAFTTSPYVDVPSEMCAHI